MQAKTKLVLAAISLAAVASLWIALRPVEHNGGEIAAPRAQEKLALDASSGPAGSTKASGAVSERAALDTAPFGGVAAIAHAGGLSVRSSVGLELPFLEWQTPLGDWLRRDLKQGRCETKDMTLPCRVRAPGHVPVEAKDGDDLVLEPDELLILEGHDLRSCTSSIRFEDPYHHLGEPMTSSLERAACSGYLSADRWAMAVSHDLVHEALFDGVASAIVIWHDQHRADVHLQPVAGARGRWTIPLEGRPLCAPLTLHVQRPSGETAGRVILKVVHPHEGVSDGQRLVFDWGSVDIQPKENLWADDAHVDATTDEHTYDALPRGENLLVFARDETSGAYGRLVFEHDGSTRTIELRPAFELVARLVSAADATPITNARLIWKFPDGKDQVYGWHCSSGRILHADDGVYRRLLPEEPLLRIEEPLDVPSAIELHVDASGFEDLEQHYLTGGHSLDCGELRLTPKPAHIVLVPGHGLGLESIEWSRLRVSESPEIEWSVRSGLAGADGSLGIYLDENENSTRELPNFHARSWTAPKLSMLQWPAGPSRWLVLYVLSLTAKQVGGAWLFERRADGRYVAVPREEREIVIECGALPPQGELAGNWQLGWTWNGQWGALGGVQTQIGRVERTRVSFPAGGASIYWSAKGPPPGVLGAPANVGGSIPVEEINGKIVLK